MTLRHALKLLLRRVPGFSGMFRRREQLREQASAIEAMRASADEQDAAMNALRVQNAELAAECKRAEAVLEQAAEERERAKAVLQQADVERERAEAALQQAAEERERAEAALQQAAEERKQAEEQKWQAVRDREQAEEARWHAVREREQTEESRWQAVREREEAEKARAEALQEQAERDRSQTAGETRKPLQWSDVPHLEKQGLFVLGQTRSGTTVLTRALNMSPDICLLSEANIHVEGNRRGFASWFNSMHRELGGMHTKGTYCPTAPDEDANAPETFDWLSRRFRYVGDKIAFRGTALGYEPEDVFAFHARHFFTAHHLCVIRNPADVIKSNSDMFQPEDLWVYADSYLQSLLLILAFAETLPNAHVLFHECVNQATFDVIGERLGVDLSGVYEASYGKELQATELWGTDHTALPWLQILVWAHRMMREVFSTETLRKTPSYPSWILLATWIRDLREDLHARGRAFK